MLVNTSILVLDKNGNKVEGDGVCLKMFMGIDNLKTLYKETIINFLPEKELYVLEKAPAISTAVETFILGNRLYTDLHCWLEENYCDIEEVVDLFDFPITVQVGEDISNISIRDILNDFEDIDQEEPYDLCDFITNRILEAIDELL